jgi:hypothetical protein
MRILGTLSIVRRQRCRNSPQFFLSLTDFYFGTRFAECPGHILRAKSIVELIAPKKRAHCKLFPKESVLSYFERPFAWHDSMGGRDFSPDEKRRVIRVLTREASRAKARN